MPWAETAQGWLSKPACTVLADPCFDTEYLLLVILQIWRASFPIPSRAPAAGCPRPRPPVSRS